MNSQHVKTDQALEELFKELTDYSRPISYNLTEIAVIPLIDKKGWLVIWRKDGR